MNDKLAKRGSETITTGFGEDTTITQGGTLSEVLAARAQAEVNASYIMAERHPRNWLQVRKNLLDAVKRPGFAGLETKKSETGEAWYAIPIRGGKPIQGFSIRFAEEVIRAMGNIDADTVVVWEGDLKRMIEVRVIDFETNVRIKSTLVIDKTVERSFLKDNEIAISQRTNTKGKIVYLRKATEDEILKKQNSAVSKTIRNGVLRLLPGDIQAACKELILDIRHGEVVEDPQAYQRQIADSFAKIGVEPQALVKWLGHDLAACSPAELADLKDMYRDIRDGTTTWAAILKAKEHKGKAKADDKDRRVEQPEDFDPVKELQFALDNKFGKAYAGSWVREQCDKLGWNSTQLTEAQAGALLDQLNDGG
jgi:hypothetical protein